MAELKTKPTDIDVATFLESVADAQRRQDCVAVAALMQAATGAPGRMWGSAIIGFGEHHYRYASGREGDWFMVGFSPRKQNLTLYLSSGIEQHADLLARLGKHTLGKGCLYIKRLSDVDLATLQTLIEQSVAQTKRGVVAAEE